MDRKKLYSVAVKIANVALVLNAFLIGLAALFKNVDFFLAYILTFFLLIYVIVVLEIMIENLEEVS